MTWWGSVNKKKSNVVKKQTYVTFLHWTLMIQSSNFPVFEENIIKSRQNLVHIKVMLRSQPSPLHSPYDQRVSERLNISSIVYISFTAHIWQ